MTRSDKKLSNELQNKIDIVNTNKTSLMNLEILNAGIITSEPKNGTSPTAPGGSIPTQSNSATPTENTLVKKASSLKFNEYPRTKHSSI